MTKTHLSDLELEQPGIEAGEINSEATMAGQVLMADGTGGAAWSTPQARAEGTALVIGDPAGGSVGASAIDIGRNRAATKRATGVGSIVIGQGATYAGAESGKSVVIGYSAQAKSGSYAVVIGAGSIAQGNHNVLIGHMATGDDDSSVGIGYRSHCGKYGVAVGYGAKSGYKGISIGYQADTRISPIENGIAIGVQAMAKATQGIAIGASTEAAGVYGIAIGYGARVLAGAGRSVVVGAGSGAEAQQSTLVGAGITINGNFSDVTAVGHGINAYGKGFTGLGCATLGAAYAVALGYHAEAYGSAAIALGKQAVANVANGLAIGPTIANATANSLKIGWNNTTGFAHFTTFTPSAGAPAATHFLPVNLGGTTYKLLLAS